MDTLQMIIKDAEVKIDFTAGKFKTFKRAEITKGASKLVLDKKRIPVTEQDEILQYVFNEARNLLTEREYIDKIEHMFKFFRLMSELSEYILIQDGDDIEVQDNMYIDSENKGRIIINTKIPHNKTSDFVMNELANINIARTAARNLYGYDPSQGPSRYFENVTSTYSNNLHKLSLDIFGNHIEIQLHNVLQDRKVLVHIHNAHEDVERDMTEKTKYYKEIGDIIYDVLEYVYKRQNILEHVRQSDMMLNQQLEEA